jgi:hypothetical protein
MPIKVANGGCSAASGFMSVVMVTLLVTSPLSPLGSIRKLIAERGLDAVNKPLLRKDTAVVGTAVSSVTGWKL